MRVEIINTGTELLLGTTLNSHGAWIGQELLKLGLRVSRQVTVPDGEGMEAAIVESVQRADVLIITGGLGPTSDDLTREITAEALELELIEDEHALRCIVGFFDALGRPMPESNKKQALIPCGAEVLSNPNGTAPGVYVPPRLSVKSPCALFLLPGPPRELYPMFEQEVPHRLRALADISAEHIMVNMKFTGVGESEFHDCLDQSLHAISGLEVGYCARPSELDLRLIGDREAVRQGQALTRAAFSKQLISEDGRSLEQVVIDLLNQKGWKISVAESCTGGAIANRMTDVSGASSVFTHGYVTYSNDAKRQLLDVQEETLQEFGAVSQQVAEQMALGAVRSSGAEVAVSVTGIAGPTGGTAEKPVGTVWIALAVKGDIVRSVQMLYPQKDRATFKRKVGQRALDLLRLELLGLE